MFELSKGPAEAREGVVKRVFADKCNLVRESFRAFHFGLYLALLARLAFPTVYQTFRVSILGSLPDGNQLNIASQMSWVNVLL